MTALAAGVRLGLLTHFDLRGIPLTLQAPPPPPPCAPTIFAPTIYPKAHSHAKLNAHTGWGAAHGNGSGGRWEGGRGGGVYELQFNRSSGAASRRPSRRLLEQAEELLSVAVAEAPFGRLESVNKLRVTSRGSQIL